MRNTTERVGGRIRRYRLIRNLTIEELAKAIGKSKGTVSKYENGSVSMDLKTLFSIAKILDVDPKVFVDFHLEDRNLYNLRGSHYFNKSTIYLYYYDGRIKDIVRSVITLTDGPNPGNIQAVLYNGLEDFNDYEKCNLLYTGKMHPMETVTYFELINPMNPVQRMYLSILNPVHLHSPAIGMMAAVGSSPFFAPVGIKCFFSNEMLAENDYLISRLKMSQEEIQYLTDYNMLVVERPFSLFLHTKNPEVPSGV